MSLTPAKLNFRIWKGATFKKRLTFYADEDGDVPRDLTGWSAELIIRPKADASPLLSLTTGDGIELDDDGNIDLYISDDDTVDITWEQGVYDLTLTDPSGDTDALVYGLFTVQGI